MERKREQRCRENGKLEGGGGGGEERERGDERKR